MLSLGSILCSYAVPKRGWTAKQPQPFPMYNTVDCAFAIYGQAEMAGQSVSQTPYEQCAVKDQQKHTVNTMKYAPRCSIMQ